MLVQIMARAREQGTPVPKVSDVGTVPVPFPYMVAARWAASPS